jgi:hypothetical protein
MQIEATTRGEWVLDPNFNEPSRSQRAPARGWAGSLTGRDRTVVALGGALFALAAASLGALVLMLPRLYTPLF